TVEGAHLRLAGAVGLGQPARPDGEPAGVEGVGVCDGDEHGGVHEMSPRVLLRRLPDGSSMTPPTLRTARAAVVGPRAGHGGAQVIPRYDGHPEDALTARRAGTGTWPART